MKKQVAAALADALLSQPPEPEALLAICVETLDNRPAWLKPLIKALLKRHGNAWHQGSRGQLIGSILDSTQFARAWASASPPLIRRFVLTAPRMAPPDVWLDACWPDLPTQEKLAQFLEVEPEWLERLTHSLQYRDNREAGPLRHYRYRWVPKRSGGFRLLEMPKARLCAIQRKILHGLLEYLPTHDAAHGFRRAHSIRTHANRHVGQQVVVRMDLQDFFWHVGSGRVRRLFRSLGYPANVTMWLTSLCTHGVPRTPTFAIPLGMPECAERSAHWQLMQRLHTPHLPQGAPTSPALANLCAFNLDLRLQGLADYFGARYSRYADDLTFSGDRDFQRSVERFIPYVGAIAGSEGFAINFRKTQVMKSSTRQAVTGIVVNEKINVDRRQFDRIKAILHNCIRHGAASQTELALDVFRQQLDGHVSHIGALNGDRGAKLRAMLTQIVWAP